MAKNNFEPWSHNIFFQVHYTTVDNVHVTRFVPDSISADNRYTTVVYFHGGGWTWLSVGKYLRKKIYTLPQLVVVLTEKGGNSSKMILLPSSIGEGTCS